MFNGLSVLLWIAQGILFIAFLLAGYIKIFAFEKYKLTAQDRSPNCGLGLSKATVTFLGICEFVGAAAVIVPSAMRVATWLTPLAAVGLAVLMISSAIYHLKRGEQVYVQFILFVLAGFVAVGRFHH